jgi:endonuclease-3 related protein
MSTLCEAFPSVLGSLVERFGAPRSDFEGFDPFEAICAVLLARNVGLEKAKKALEFLREADLLSPEALSQGDLVELTDALGETAASVSHKALAPLKRFASLLVRDHDGRIAAIFDPHRSSGWLRGELASMKGISMADADAVLLYGLRWPAYPVDRATVRVLVRHGWLDPTATYNEVRDLVVDCAATDRSVLDERELVNEDDYWVQNLMDLARGMEQVGRRYCKPATPHCEECPLASFLPEGGFRQLDE